MARGGGVLLNDEDAGADAADRELLVALDLDALARHLGDPGARRPLAKEVQQRLDRGLRALGVDEHLALLPVADPAQHAQLVRPAQCRFAEADALHRAAHGRPHGDGAVVFLLRHTTIVARWGVAERD